MYKKISFRNAPKPGPGNRAGFFIARTRGTPTPEPDIAPSAAMQIARVIDVHLRAISTNDLEARMTKLEKDRANSAADDVAGGEIFR